MNSQPNNLRKFLFLAAVALQAALLITLIARKEHTLRTGRTIIVKTVPVDPRDILRGDFVRLNYAFSRIDLKDVQTGGAKFNKGDDVYITLSRGSGDWKAVRAEKDLSSDIPVEDIILKGTIKNRDLASFLQVSYGIETYFVPEGEGKDLERGIRDNQVSAEIAVDKSGKALIRRIFLNGKEVTFR